METPGSYERAFALFREARALPGPARDGWLEGACAGDEALRRRVLALLAHDAAEDRIAGVVAAAASRAAEGEGFRGEPDRIGRYRIVRRIAEGGMGIVYEAVQEHPSRTVALKVVRPDIATDAVLRRFETEAEALAQFSHPGIAQIYEAGTHDGPRGPQPYLAMELVRGTPLEEWVRGRTSKDRLDLVAEIAEAVQHAHQRGVIHRDLKPANVLVQDGRPKILDFGIARLTGAGSGSTQATVAGQVLGTLPYMSPEQLAGGAHDIDTRTDVYAIGVILYRLLGNRLPIDVTADSFPTAVKRICEEEPPRLGTLDTRLRGDVETIAAKALAKERAERYASAQAIADDIRRHLADQPIEARPPSALYVLRKFARRRKGLVAGLAVAAAALVALGVRERSARSLAEERAAEAHEQRDAARWAAYRASVASALSALLLPDVTRAEGLLAVAPEEHRGFEWEWIRARLDDASFVWRAEGPAGYLRTPAVDGDEAAYLEIAADAVLVRRPLDGGPVRLRTRLPSADAFLAAGGRLGVVRQPGSAQLFDATTGEPGRRLDFGSQFCLLGRDGRRFVHFGTTPPASSLRVHDAHDGKLVAQWTVPGTGPGCVDASPDCSRVAVGTTDGEVLVFEAGTEGPRWRRRCHSASVYSLAFDADGTRVVSAAGDSTVAVWDLTRDEIATSVRGRTNEITSALLSPDGTLVATGGPDGTVRLWSASTGLPLAVLVGHRAAVHRPEFSADGTRLITWSDDGTVRVWETSARDDDCVLVGHRSYVYEARASPDGTTIATCAWDGTVRLWDRTGRETRKFDLGPGWIVNTVAWRPDGARLAISAYGPERAVRVVDPRTGAEEWALKRSPLGGRGIAYSPQGGLLALALPDALFLLDSSTYEERGRLPLTDVEAIAFSPDGRRLAASRDRTIEVWDPAAARRLLTLDGHSDLVRCVAFDPSGRTLASASWDGAVRVWDVATGAALATLRGNGRRVHAVAFMPDGRRLLTGGDDGLVVVWDTERFESLVALPGHRSYVHGIDVFPDGRTLVSASGDGTGRLWTTTPRCALLRARRAGR